MNAPREWTLDFGERVRIVDGPVVLSDCRIEVVEKSALLRAEADLEAEKRAHGDTRRREREWEDASDAFEDALRALFEPHRIEVREVEPNLGCRYKPFCSCGWTQSGRLGDPGPARSDGEEHAEEAKEAAWVAARSTLDAFEKDTVVASTRRADLEEAVKERDEAKLLRGEWAEAQARCSEAVKLLREVVRSRAAKESAERGTNAWLDAWETEAAACADTRSFLAALSPQETGEGAT